MVIESARPNKYPKYDAFIFDIVGDTKGGGMNFDKELKTIIKQIFQGFGGLGERRRGISELFGQRFKI